MRLFVEAPLHEAAEIAATEPQAHHLVHVMRLPPGGALALFNGRDGEWHATLAATRRGRATLHVHHQTRPQTAGPDLWLAFAPLKRDATDLAIRQATELGVSALLPVLCAHSNTARTNPDRWAAITREAAEQSERLDLPAILPLTPLFDVLAAWPPERALAAAIERAHPSPLPAQAAALLVGPEGGFAPAELDALRAARFVSPIHLGPRVLRAETAIVAGLALLQSAAWSTSSAQPRAVP